jgi:hypothetical protein
MKHHYVPVFYQKHFAATSDGLLWVYDRLLNTLKQLHPISICCQHDLYAVKIPGSAFEQVIETEFLHNIDRLASIALNKLPRVLASPGPQLLGEIIYFVALQYTRVPANKKMISEIYEAGANDFMDVAFANVERAAVMMKKYATETGEELKVTPESMVEAVRSKSIKAIATEMPFLHSVVKHTEFIAKVFNELNIKILVSPPQVGFVLSDNPVTMVPPPGMAVAGFKSPDTFVFVPLTRSLCLRLGQPGSGTGPRDIDRETVRLINENTAVNSDRFVMGPSKIQIESVIRCSGSTDMSRSERWMTNRIPDRKGGILRELVSQPRQVHYLDL